MPFEKDFPLSKDASTTPTPESRARDFWAFFVFRRAAGVSRLVAHEDLKRPAPFPIRKRLKYHIVWSGSQNQPAATGRSPSRLVIGIFSLDVLV